MATGSPNYLKAAFANVYNLSMLGGALAASAATGDYVVGVVALGLEALWLLFAPDLKPFQRAVNRAEREEAEKADRARVAKLLESLPERDWSRAHALDELRREIERDMQVNPSFKAILLQTELDKLKHLHASFVTLAVACNRAETYLQATDLRELKRQLEAQQNIDKSMQDASVKEIAKKNAEVLQRRMDTIQQIQTFLARARGQMSLIENSVRLLRDQVLTMANPDQLGEQLDDLVTGVDAIQASARENEALFSTSTLQPVAPVEAESAEAGRARSGERVR